jgi:uncharacterized damage-inducible protein DinB
MSEYTAEMAEFSRQSNIRNIGFETQTLMKVIGAFTDETLDFKPHEKNMTAGDLIWHILTVEKMFLVGATTGEFPMDQAPARPTTVKGLQEAYTAQHEKLMDTFSKTPATNLQKPLSFMGMPAMPQGEYVRWHEGHLIHHRGQLSVYLRLAGLKVPAIYGDSADEKMTMPEA